MKDKNTTTLLCLFLGGLGAHHYYLGNTTKAIFYTVFCITLVPGLIAFFEFIGFATMTVNDFHRKYNASYIEDGQESADLDRLGKLSDLKEKGAITEDEYLKRKAKLIA